MRFLGVAFGGKKSELFGSLGSKHTDPCTMLRRLNAPLHLPLGSREWKNGSSSSSSSYNCTPFLHSLLSTPSSQSQMRSMPSMSRSLCRKVSVDGTHLGHNLPDSKGNRRGPARSGFHGYGVCLCLKLGVRMEILQRLLHQPRVRGRDASRQLKCQTFRSPGRRGSDPQPPNREILSCVVP